MVLQKPLLEKGSVLTTSCPLPPHFLSRWILPVKLQIPGILDIFEVEG